METGWLKRAVGEMSKLRIFSTWSLNIKSFFIKAWKLDSSEVDAALARALYDNTDDRYKLGAGFCRRVINAKSGFMGIPAFISEDPEAQKELDEFFGGNTSAMGQVHKKALIEGDCIVRITREETENALYPETKAHLVFNIIPKEQLDGIIRDPITRQPIQYAFSYTNEWYDDNGNLKRTYIKEIISATKRIIQQEGDLIPGLPAEEDNNWGFIPIIHFKNEADETREYGQSDLEPIEPFLKAYHDLLFNALQASHMHSTPRLKFKLKDVAAFLQNNFGIANPREFAEKGGTITLDGKEFFIFGDGEDAGFIEVQSPSSGINDLLKFLFYCIVDASETPEFMFGVHTPSALSSVKEQMPAFIRTITRKRQNFTDAWQRLARIVLAMKAQASGKQFTTYATSLEWDEVDPRDEKEFAETLNYLAQGLKMAIDGGFLSVQAAAEFLKTYIPTMLEFDSEESDETEKNRIIADKLIQGRLEDGAANMQDLKELLTLLKQKTA